MTPIVTSLPSRVARGTRRRYTHLLVDGERTDCSLAPARPVVSSLQLLRICPEGSSDLNSCTPPHTSYAHTDDINTEYQDCNEVQVDLVNLLQGERRCVTVVGDDAQSIYKCAAWIGNK